MDITSHKHNPFNDIKLVTIIKITECHLYYHEEDNPDTQNSINGLTLVAIGDVAHANIEDSADYGDDKKVKEFVSLNPYTQISISGLALDGMGDVVHAIIEDSADYGDDKRVKEFVSLYTPGSLHWIESQTFCWSGDELCFYNIEKSLPVADEDSDEIERLFLQNHPAENEPEKPPDESIIRMKTSHVGKDMENRTVIMNGCLEHIKIWVLPD